MKTGTLVVAGLLLSAVVSATAQTSMPEGRTINTAAAVKNYLACLNSATDAVVESAMNGIIGLQLAVPTENLALLHNRLDELAFNGRTAGIRFKAYLAAAVLENPGMFKECANTRPENSDEVFLAVASKLQISLLGYSVQ